MSQQAVSRQKMGFGEGRSLDRRLWKEEEGGREGGREGGSSASRLTCG
jgi:hypothetical protein